MQLGRRCTVLLAETAADLDLSVLDAITDAVESGAGLHEVVRAAGRALDASLVLTDRGAPSLAVAARSPADEAALMADGDGVEALRAARRRRARRHAARARAGAARPTPALVRLVTTLIASEVERVRAPSARVARRRRPPSCTPLFDREQADRESVVARSRASWGFASMRARPSSSCARTRCVPAERGLARARRWRSPSAARAPPCPARWPRRARATAPRAEVVVLLPGDDEAAAAPRRRGACCASCRRRCPAIAFAVGRSRVAAEPADLHRAANEALLAANVAEGDRRARRCSPSRRPAPTGCCCRP